MNEEYPRTDFYDVEPNEEEILDITVEEVEAAVKQMKNNKAVGPDQIPVFEGNEGSWISVPSGTFQQDPAWCPDA